MPFRRHIGEQFEMDAAFGVVAITREPRLLRGEAQDRREPAHQAIEGAVEHGARGATARVVEAVAIEPVLSDVEIERAEIDGTEIMQRGKHRVEIVVGERLPHGLVELGEAVQHPALELRHFRGADRLGRREPGECAQEIAQRVAQAAIAVAHMLQDLGADPQILGVIRGDDPDPQDVGAALPHDILRRDDIAQ